MNKIENSFGLLSYGERIIPVRSLADLDQYYKNPKGEDRLILGGGYNILPPPYFQGDILKSNIEHIQVASVHRDHVVLRVGSGVNWDSFVAYATKKNLFGLEGLSYIPGTVGAAPIQNIGAYGAEVGQFIVEVACFNLTTGEIEILDNSNCEFGYRTSVFKRRPELFVTEVVFSIPSNQIEAKKRLTNCSSLSYKEYIWDSAHLWRLLARFINVRILPRPRIQFNSGIIRDALLLTVIPSVLKRKMVQKIRSRLLHDPIDVGNSGCVFKNPIISTSEFLRLKESFPSVQYFSDERDAVKLAAGWLIKDAGWAGREISGIKIDERSAVVFLNSSNATYDGAKELLRAIQCDVLKRYGINLEPEVVFVPTPNSGSSVGC